MHQTLTCVVINCMTNKGMTNGRLPCIRLMHRTDKNNCTSLWPFSVALGVHVHYSSDKTVCNRINIYIIHDNVNT